MPSNPGSITIHQQKFTAPKDGWMTQWGGASPNLVWAVVNGFDLGPAKDKFKFILACRIDDATKDEDHDASIERSGSFVIKPESIRMGIPVSQTFMARTIPPKFVWVYLLLMPSAVQPEQIRTLSDLARLGGGILIKNGFEFAGHVVAVPVIPHS